MALCCLLLAALLSGCLPMFSVSPDSAGADQGLPTAMIAVPTPTIPIATSAVARYDEEKNSIVLSDSGGLVSLPLLAQALPTRVLREVAPGEWLLSANLRIEQGANLEIGGPQVRWLKLHSRGDNFVWIKALGGRLRIVATRITSWDPQREDYDHNYEDGRSFLLARDGAQMEISDSELSYLGYEANESYGVAWRLKSTGGAASNSVFGHNFYGLYLYEVSGLVIRGNEVHHSVRYGIDPHTRSNKLLIENNTSHHNGKQGIILAEGCAEGIIRNNVVHSNGLHGIVLFQHSNDNLVEGNTSYDNALHGININGSNRNTVRGNTVYGNGEAGIGIGQEAAGNLIDDNIVRTNLRDGIYLFSDASKNSLQNNLVIGNPRYGIYIKSEENMIGGGNEVLENGVGVFLNVDQPPQISTSENRIYNNRDADIRGGEGG
jgi:parallel beta-helix repeat protein